jgi:hypothetical protein
LAILTSRHDDAQINRPQGLSCFFDGELRVSDKLLIDLWGATISADGIYAISAAVIIVLLVHRRLR